MKLTPTENLALEVLIARYRTGEHLWTFDSEATKALNKLEEKGLVFTMHGTVEHTIRAGLSEKGKKKFIGDYTPPNGIQDPVALVLDMVDFRNFRAAWVRSQAREESEAIYGHGGASVPPYWNRVAEEQAFLAYLQGERQPDFDGTYRDEVVSTAEEIGYSVTGTKGWNLTIHDEDLPAYGGYDAWSVYFEPDGTFYAAHWRKYHFRAFKADVPREETFRAFLETMREARKMDLADPTYIQRVESERRSRERRS